MPRNQLQKKWEIFPYDLHRMVVEQIMNSRDLVCYLEAFQTCDTIGDLILLLKLHYSLRYDALNSIAEFPTFWPKIFVKKEMGKIPGFTESLSLASHFYRNISFSKDFKDAKLIKKMVLSLRPDILYGDTGSPSTKILKHSQLTIFINDLNKSQISQINLAEIFIGDLGAYSLSQAIVGMNIYQLDLRDCKIGEMGFKSLGSSLKNTKISYLYLSRNYGGDDGLNAIFDGIVYTNITYLSVGYNDGGPISCNHLADLISKNKLPKLSYLKISGNEVLDEGICSLAKALICSKIRLFEARSCFFGNIGAKALANILHMTSVTKLDISGNDIAYDSFKLPTTPPILLKTGL